MNETSGRGFRIVDRQRESADEELLVSLADLGISGSGGDCDGDAFNSLMASRKDCRWSLQSSS